METRLDQSNEMADVREARKEIIRKCRDAARDDRSMDVYRYAFAYTVLSREGEEEAY